MSESFSQLMSSPFGEIAFTVTTRGLTHLAFQQGQASLAITPSSKQELSSEIKRIVGETELQLSQYFSSQRQHFELPLAPHGTDFQKQIWQTLLSIEQGKTISYADVARAIANPKAVRAVGTAIGKNPIALVIPCHRVIGQSGKLTGYAGGLGLKAKLLDFEQASYRV